MYDHSNYQQVREEILDSLDRYAQTGCPTGGFLESVLSNNLMESFGRADASNRVSLFNICEYIYNELPADCHGSPKRVAEYLEAFAEKRQNAPLQA